MICLTVRDCYNYLDSVFININKLNEIFTNLKIVFFYDKSKDKTLKKLTEYKNKLGDDMIILKNKNIKLSKYRTVRLAYARNQLKKYIDAYFDNYNFFIMMDPDDVCCGDINVDIIKKYIDRLDWDCLTFNHYLDNYYDIWALSFYPYLIHYLKFENSPREMFYIRKAFQNQIKKLEEDELLDCYSAFAGFGIYRKEKFNNCIYDGVKQFNLPQYIIDRSLKLHLLAGINFKLRYCNENCEHRSFHIQAITKNKAKIRIAKDYLFDKYTNTYNEKNSEKNSKKKNSEKEDITEKAVNRL